MSNVAVLRPPVWVAGLAARFWSLAGPPPGFPRDLARAATDALPLSVIDTPRLRLDSVRDYLSRLGIAFDSGEPDRALRAALYCERGAGFVFLDSDDPPDERRFSLAHEIAHYLRDCDAPRRRVEKSLGVGALAVLDGARPATRAERLSAVLGSCPLGAITHVMGRDEAGRPGGPAERDAEDAADRLAFELLAPAHEFADRGEHEAAAARLVAEFGLPISAARAYSRLLYPPEPAGFFG